RYVLQTPLDLADVFQIFVEPRAIRTRQGPVQARDFLRDGVEKTGLRFAALHALLRIAAIAEQAFKYDLRIGFMRQRLRRTGPGDGVNVRAAIAPRARGERALVLDAELDRWQGGILPVLFGDHLVDSGAEIDVVADGF